MAIPGRLRRQVGTHALVDGIPFEMPVSTHGSQAFMAGFTIDADRAAALMPGKELHPYRLWGNRGLLLVTVVNYVNTTIGKYIEYSVGIACTHGERPAPPLLPALLRGRFDFGQYVVELPVSTEISVKGGKGIWGMPKYQASIDFLMDDRRVSSQYDLDGRLAVRADIARPKRSLFPLTIGAVNFCQFRGMLNKSSVNFEGKPYFALFPFARGSLTLGDQPRIAPLKQLNISKRPLMTIFYPDFGGALDDHSESWFLTADAAPEHKPEGLESVINLGLSQEWLPPPHREG
jgi:hypothetical protein